MLYTLRSKLEQNGFEAKIFVLSDEVPKENIYCQHLTNQNRENDIVVYPEIVFGNPLGFRNVVRWVLNVPGKLGGEKKYHEGESIFSFDSKVLKGYPYLNFDTVDHSLFYDAKFRKTQNCVFIYKGGKCREIPELNGCKLITINSPADRKKLALLLQTTNILYSYDDDSSLLKEAIYCGARVKIIKKNKIVDYKEKTRFDEKLSERQFQCFIKTTQSKNYKGDINSKGRITLFKYVLFSIERILLLFANDNKVKQRLNYHRTLRHYYRWNIR